MLNLKLSITSQQPTVIEVTLEEKLHTRKMCIKIGDVIVDTTTIKHEDLEQLKRLLPELQQSGKTLQLEIIMEAIQYIKRLQEKLIN